MFQKWWNEIITKCSLCLQPIKRKDYHSGKITHRSSYDLGTHKACYDAW